MQYSYTARILITSETPFALPATVHRSRRQPDELESVKGVACRVVAKCSRRPEKGS